MTQQSSSQVAAGEALPMQPASLALARFAAVADGVARLGVVFVNVYAVDANDGSGRWVLVDTGLPRFADYVRQAVAARYGPGARPEAIILTHGHFDHASNAAALADDWGVPVYCHPLEMPYLTGVSDYPPQDPTPGGAICFLSRFFPRGGFDLSSRVRPLPPDGSVPGLPGWRWIHTPGHTVGHVSLFREGDRTLIAGDALATMDMDAWSSHVTHRRELGRPATPFTPDWDAAARSVDALAALMPWTITAGHGLPLAGPPVAADLTRFSQSWRPPPGGRYTPAPAKYAATGALAAVPPPVPDPTGRTLKAVAAVAVVAVLLGATTHLRRRR